MLGRPGGRWEVRCFKPLSAMGFPVGRGFLTSLIIFFPEAPSGCGQLGWVRWLLWKAVHPSPPEAAGWAAWSFTQTVSSWHFKAPMLPTSKTNTMTVLVYFFLLT